MKLTPKQNAVIWCLQNGWQLITNCDMKGAWVAKQSQQFHINGGIFWNLYKKELIYQQPHPPFDYVLTELGKTIKTRKVEI